VDDEQRLSLLLGDCIERLRELPAASIDACVCDPPYGLEFMGAEWDRLDGDGFRRAENPEDAGRENVFGRTSRTSPEYKTGGAGIEADAKSAGGYGQESDTNENAYAAARVRYGAPGRAMQEWHEAWAREVFRVLKPGGWMLAFSGTRTYHRLACGVEDAGFEVRDQIDWVYGSGFPKGINVGKAIDKKLGAEREVVGRATGRKATPVQDFRGGALHAGGPNLRIDCSAITAPATPEAAAWEGWNTALKPGHEPVVVARKPLEGTVVENVLAHGTGALNIGGCRIGTVSPGTKCSDWPEPCRGHGDPKPAPEGRWPANLILQHSAACVLRGTKQVRSSGETDRPLETGSGPSTVLMGGVDGSLNRVQSPGFAVNGLETVEDWECASDCPVRQMDEQSGNTKSVCSNTFQPVKTSRGFKGGAFGNPEARRPDGHPTDERYVRGGFTDVGGASRFFHCLPYEAPFLYVAKPAKGEKNAGLEHLAAQRKPWCTGDTRPGKVADGMQSYAGRGEQPSVANHHPTVKGVQLMRLLIRLCCRRGATVLDPFLGSGTTGVAAFLEGMSFVGIEREESYYGLAQERLRHVTMGIECIHTEAERPPPRRVNPQPSLFE
jgi:DNA modification methylase